MKIEILEKDIVCLNGDLKDVIEILQHALNSVPDEYKNKAIICFDIDDYYGSSFLISYNRPNTPEEDEKLKSDLDAKKEEQRARLQKQLDALSN